MPVIKFTQADKLKSALLPDGWYNAEITKIEGPKKSSGGKSFNTFFTITVIEGDYKDKELLLVFNNKMNNPSVAGTMQLWPQEYMLQLVAAVHGIPFDEIIPDNVNTDDLLHVPFDVKVIRGVYEGIPTNTIQAFLPYNKGVEESNTVPF